MGHSRYVGRVGALAVALGVGWAATAGVGIAVADSPSDGPSGGTTAGTGSPEGATGAGGISAGTTGPADNGSPTGATTTTTTNGGTGTAQDSTSVTTTVGGTTVSGTTITGTLNPTATPSETASPTKTPTVSQTTATPTPAAAPSATPTQTPSSPTTGVTSPAAATPPATTADSPSGAADDLTSATRTSPTTPRTATSDDPAPTVANAKVSANAAESSTAPFARAAAGGAADPTSTAATANALIAPSAISTQPAGPIEMLLIVPTRIVVGLVSLLVSPVVGTPVNPVTPGPVFELLVAFYRRIDNYLFNVSPTARPTVTGQSATGVITGNLNATDANGDPLTYRVSAQPANGKVEVTSTGEFTYTPNPDFAKAGGPDGFTVVVDDSAGFHLFGFLTQRAVSVPVSLTVTPINQAPVFTQQAAISGQNGVTGTITGTSKATDPNGDTVTYTIKAGDTTATVTVDATGGFTYTPTDAARHAAVLNPTSDTVTITASDGRGLSATSTVSVPVLGRNADPVTGGLTNVVTDPVTGKVTGSLNVSDPDNTGGVTTDVLVYTPASFTTNRGTFTVDGNGFFTYQPFDTARHDAAKLGSTATTDTATFTVTDGYGGRLEIPVTVAISPRNAAPAATSAATVNLPGSDGSVTGNVNIADADSDPLTFTSTTPARGSVVVNGDGSFTYRPTDAARIAAAGSGPKTDTFSVTAADGYGGVTPTPVSVTVTIAPLNIAPVAGTPGDTTVDYATGAVTGKVNFTDANGNPLSYSVSQQPVRGTVTVGVDGTFTFTPTAAQRLLANTAAGPTTATFTIAASDGSLSTPTTVTVAIDPARVAVTDVVKTPTTIVDVGAAPTSVYTIGNNGLLTKIDPATGQVVGTTQITGTTNTEYLAVSGDGRYVYVSGGGGRVVAVDTESGTQTPYTVTGTPRDLVAVTLPSGQQRLYVTSRDTGRVTVIDPSGTVANVVVTLPAGAMPNNITASRDGATIYATNTGTNSISIIDTATNQIHTLAIGSSPQGLATSADGRYVYVANGGANQISVLDTTTGTVSSIVVAAPSRSVSVSPDGTLAYATLSNGTVSVIDTATNTVIGTPITVGSTPQYVAFTPDGQAYLTSFTGGINVLKVVSVNVNVAPIGVRSPSVSVNATTGIATGNLNVTDANGDALTYTPTSVTTAKGTFTVAANGTYTYRPTDDARHAAAATGAPAEALSDSFTVSVSDGRGGTRSVTVTVPISPRNAAPAATSAPTVNLPGADGSVTGNVNIADADSDPLTFTSTTPARGSVIVNADGSFTYRPTQAARIAAAGSGPKTDTFSVTAADGYGGVTPTAVSITVSIAPLNVAPVAGTPSSPSTDYASGIVTGKVNFTDANGNALTYHVAQQPVVGTVSVAADGTYTYTPTLTQRLAAFSSGPKTATFTVAASDGSLETPTSVTVTIDPVRYVVMDSLAVGRAPIDTATTVYASARVWVIGNSGILTAIDPATGTVVKTIQVTGATNTEYLTTSASPTQDYVYVSDGAGRVVVVNTVTGDQKSIAVGGTPRDLVAVRSGNQDVLYVASRDTSKVTVVDPVAATTRTLDLPAGSTPNNIVASADGKFVVVSNNGTNSLTFIDTATDAQTSVAVGRFPQGLDVTGDGRYVYVTNRDDDTVSVVDVVGKTVSKTIAVGDGPRAVKLSNDGTLAFVTNQSADTVTVIDTATNTVVGQVAVGDSPQYFAIPTTGDVYVTNANSGTVSVLRPVSVNVNSAPVNVRPPSSGIPDGSTGVVSGSLNVSDPDANTLTYTPNSGTTTKGTFTVTANGVYGYTPTEAARRAAGAAGATAADKQDSFTVTVTDGRGGSTQVTVPVTVLGLAVNTPPTIADQSVIGPEDQTRVITLTGVDPDTGTTLTYTIVTQPAHGTLGPLTRVDAVTQRLVYTPNADFNGSDSFTYTASDGSDASNVATVSITVTPVNDAPGAGNAVVPDVAENTPRTITLTGTDVDAGTTLTFTITQPSHGTLTGGTRVDATSVSYTYTPNANYTGPDSFSYRAYDGSAFSTSATVSITVNRVAQQAPLVAALPGNATALSPVVVDPSTGVGYFIVRSAVGMPVLASTIGYSSTNFLSGTPVGSVVTDGAGTAFVAVKVGDATLVYQTKPNGLLSISRVEGEPIGGLQVANGSIYLATATGAGTTTITSIAANQDPVTVRTVDIVGVNVPGFRPSNSVVVYDPVADKVYQSVTGGDGRGHLLVYGTSGYVEGGVDDDRPAVGGVVFDPITHAVYQTFGDATGAVVRRVDGASLLTTSSRPVGGAVTGPNGMIVQTGSVTNGGVVTTTVDVSTPSALPRQFTIAGTPLGSAVVDAATGRVHQVTLNGDGTSTVTTVGIGQVTYPGTATGPVVLDPSAPGAFYVTTRLTDGTTSVTRRAPDGTTTTVTAAGAPFGTVLVNPASGAVYQSTERGVYQIKAPVLLMNPNSGAIVNPLQDNGTGAATGKVNAIATGVTYQLGTPPKSGTVTLGADGSFTYTPDPVARLAAKGTASTADDTDVFTVRVSNGTTTQTVVITPSVSPSSVAAVYVAPPGAVVVGTPVLELVDRTTTVGYAVVRDSAGTYSVNVFSSGGASPRKVDLPGEPAADLDVDGTTAVLVTRTADGKLVTTVIRPTGSTPTPIVGTTVDSQLIDVATGTVVVSTDAAITVIPRTGSPTTIAVDGVYDRPTQYVDGGYFTTVEKSGSYSVLVIRPDATSYTAVLPGALVTVGSASDGRLAAISTSASGASFLNLVRTDGTTVTASVPGVIADHRAQVLDSDGAYVDSVAVVGNEVVQSRVRASATGAVSTTTLQSKTFTGTAVGSLHLNSTGSTAYFMTVDRGVYSMVAVVKLDNDAKTATRSYALTGAPMDARTGRPLESVFNDESGTIYQLTTAADVDTPAYRITMVDTLATTPETGSRTWALTGKPVGSPVVQTSTGIAYLVTTTRDGAWVNVLNVALSTPTAVAVPLGTLPDDLLVDQETGVARFVTNSSGTYQFRTISPNGASAATTLSGAPKGQFTVDPATGYVYVPVAKGSVDGLDVITGAQPVQTLALPGKMVSGDLILVGKTAVYLLTKDATGVFKVTTVQSNLTTSVTTLSGSLDTSNDPILIPGSDSLLLASSSGGQGQLTVVNSDGTSRSLALAGRLTQDALNSDDQRVFVTSVDNGMTTVTSVSADGMFTSVQMAGAATRAVDFGFDGVYQTTSAGTYLVALPTRSGSTAV
ncbi:Ig-like domain-containing protein [Mycobacterium sp. NPDC006124]|uniref:tandem-95 repeat protein n=1 Tax=Mycobacterium sp. NPDC006124 TaxID=3156729 RepID=UPI0033B05844